MFKRIPIKVCSSALTTFFPFKIRFRIQKAHVPYRRGVSKDHRTEVLHIDLQKQFHLTSFRTVKQTRDR